MRLTLLLVLTSLLGAAPALADAPASPNRGKSTSPATDPSSIRRTGRLPAVIEVTPAGSTAPVRLVVTIPRDRLKGVLLTPAVAGGAVPLADDPDTPTGVVRHVLAAGFLALAILSVPVLWGGRRRRGAAVVALALALTAATALVRAEIAAPHAPPAPPVPGPTPAASQAATPQTVEVVLVPGAGPIHVQVTYARP